MGAFTWDGYEQIDSITADPEGWLWMAGWEAQGSWLVNMRDGIKLANRNRQEWTSQEWLQMYEDGFMNNWRLRVKYFLNTEQAGQAVGLLERTITNPRYRNDKTVKIDAMMLKGAIVSDCPTATPLAVRIFEDVLQLTDDPAVEYLAKKNLGMLYYKMKKYDDAVKYLSQIPDRVRLQYVNVGEDHKYSYLVDQPVGYYLQQAREKAKK